MHGVTAVIGCLLLLGCHRMERPARTAEDEPDRYRPGWIAAIAMNVDAVRACTDDRLAPTLVLDVSARPSGATGVTSVDGMGVVERCAFHDGRIVHRSRFAMRPAQLTAAGLPVFVLGAEPPTGATNVLLEEVHGDDRELIGWLYWPAEQSADTEGERHAYED